MRIVKLLVLAGLVGGVGYIAWAKMLRAPEKRACARLTELCQERMRDANDGPGECDEYFDALKRTSPESLPRTASCVSEARSCGQAVGCMTGGAIHMGAGFVRDFADGLNKALKQ
jgi:hypothetical protein